MSIHPIIKMGHPTLRQVAKTVAPEDMKAQMRTLIANMIETLHDAGGIGLAAPQINQAIQLAIIEVPGPSRYGVMNPTAHRIFQSGIDGYRPGEAGYWEGCLSVRVCAVYVSAAACPSGLHGRIRQEATLELQGFLATVVSTNLIIWPGGFMWITYDMTQPSSRTNGWRIKHLSPSIDAKPQRRNSS